MNENRSPLRVTHRRFGTVCALLATAVLALAQGLAQAQSSAPDGAAASGSQPDKAAIRARKRLAADQARLDLHAPPLNHIYPRKQLQELLTADDSADVDATEVSVTSPRYESVVPGGPGNQFVAIPWAILHPTQAWRIFTPMVQP